MHKFVGYFIIFLCCVNTVTFWLFAKEDMSYLTRNPLLSLSQISSLLGLVLMSLSLVFSTRFSILEDIFGGLDSDYMVHTILGSISFLLLMNHPLLLVANVLPRYFLADLYLLPSEDFANTLGVLAIYTMLFSFLFIVLIKIPYQKWLWTHRVLVVSFLLGCLHTFFVSSDISRDFLLQIWMYPFMFFGALSSFYILFLYRWIGPRFTYVVVSSQIKNSIVDLVLRPESRRMNFKAGQFIYSKFFLFGLSTEMHPFTISSAPWEDTLRLTAKVLGDFTKKLGLIREGDKVVVYGPYGRFGEFFYKSNDDLVFIAGGIGVTPFLSMIRYETVYAKARRIFFFFTFHNESDLVFLEEIKAAVAYAPNITFIPWSSKDQGHISASKVNAVIGPQQGYSVLLCGPAKMMTHLKEQFVNLGIDEDQVIFENFNYL